MIDLEIRMRARLEAVFGHDLVVTFSGPMAKLTCPVRADVGQVGRADRARRERRIGNDRLRQPGTGQEER
jgi:hypothetical protein